MDAVKEIIMKDLEIFLDESILPEIDKKLNPPEEEAAETEKKLRKVKGPKRKIRKKRKAITMWIKIPASCGETFIFFVYLFSSQGARNLTANLFVNQWRRRIKSLF